MEDSAVSRPDDYDNPDADAPSAPAPSRQTHSHPGFSHWAVTFARPALIAGITIAIVCAVLLLIIYALDSFNATVYSVNGKNIQDATEEAREIRDTYAGARIGGIIALVVSAVVAVAAGVVWFLNRGTSVAEADDGEDVDFDDLTGS